MASRSHAVFHLLRRSRPPRPPASWRRRALDRTQVHRGAKGYDSCSVHFAHADQLCRKIIEGMPTWLRSLVNAFLGKVPGKTSRLDTATRMMIDADFSLRRELPREARPTVIRTPVNKRSLKDEK
jgi:hypothetical protein